MKSRRQLTIIACCVLFSLGTARAAETPYDLVLRNARVVDGTGNPWYRADIAIRGDVIARIAPSIDEPATRVVDIGGLVVAPGFIDLHTHAMRGIFLVPTADNYVRQGVTTIMEGPDGGSPVPLKPFLDKLAALPKSLNIGSFIGQGSVREAVIGLANRPATAEELERMRGIVRDGMRDGAFGMSTGLFYVPGNFTPLAEVVELQKVVAPFRGLHTSHMRDEASRVIDSVKETIAIGEQGGVPTQISHHKIIGKSYWGKSVETLKLVEEARARGFDATIDQYPYTASSTSIGAALLPQWAQEGGHQATVQRLKDAPVRAKIKSAIADSIRDERGGGDPANIVVSICDWDAKLAGKNLAELTVARGQAVNIDNAAETTMWIVEQGNCGGVFHAMDEQDLQRIIRHPATMIASDGTVPIFGLGAPHPRSYGTLARVLAVYVRDKKILTLEDAVRKMSSYPAARLGLTDRGVLKPGMKADIAVFDPATVKDMATFEKPHQYAVGFPYVIVNGKIVYENGAMTAERPGRVLYGPGAGFASR
ncbi:MAG: N-acyl-D-amino-acid deacylase [Betaproteobacteria bacterium]|nr:N-acyl-D-amino-acid deacylase [Betaproteobacteria bacterium]